MQIVLHRHLNFYNHHGAYQGHRTRGRNPAEIFTGGTRHDSQPKKPCNAYTNPVLDSSTDTVTTPMLLKTMASGRLQPDQLTTYRFTSDQVMQAYATFGDVMNEHPLQVILTSNAA